MSAVKTSLLLLLAALGANARPGAHNCDGLNATLPVAHLHQVFGDWVLVWAVADNERGSALFGHVSSSTVELRLRPDNRTASFSQRTRVLGNQCSNYFNNMTLPAEDSDNGTLHILSAAVEVDGNLHEFNESGGMDFFKSCDVCLSLVYRNQYGRHLMNYRRRGLHQDVVQQQQQLSSHRKQAECLGFPPHRPFSYHGADLCQKETQPAES